MSELKLVINDVKTGKSYPKSLDIDLSGNKIGNKISGDLLGLKGYELEITGGSDSAGFPMHPSIETAARRKAFLGGGVGVTRKRLRKEGIRIRTTVRGNTIGANTAQINLKILKYGAESLEKVLGIEKKEEKSVEEKPKQEVKEEKKAEEKKVEVPKKEELKQEVKVEEKPKEVKVENKK